jgi:hypothetical protein
MMCVTTRFQLKHFWDLLPMYLAYRRMRGDLRKAPGLIRYAFLLQSPVAFCTLSVWESENALERFANVSSHVHALRYAKRQCRDIWSAYWRIDAISRHANQWQGAAGWPELVPHATHPNRLVQPLAPEAVQR